MNNPGAKHLFDRWQTWLGLPNDELIALILHPDEIQRDMRQVTPFAGILTPKERVNILSKFRKEYRE